MKEQEYETGDLYETVYELLISVKDKIGNADWENIHCYLFGKENRYEYTFSKSSEFPAPKENIAVMCEEWFLNDLNEKTTFTKKQILNCKFNAKRIFKNQKDNEIIQLKVKDVIIKGDDYYQLQTVSSTDTFNLRRTLENVVETYSFRELVQNTRNELKSTNLVSEDIQNYCCDIIWPTIIENKLKEVYNIKMNKLVPQYHETQKWIELKSEEIITGGLKRSELQKECIDFLKDKESQIKTEYTDNINKFVQESENCGLKISKWGFASCKLELIEILKFWIRFVNYENDDQIVYNEISMIINTIFKKVIELKEPVEGITVDLYEYLKFLLQKLKEIEKRNDNIQVTIELK